MNHPHLLSPGRIGAMTLRNRILMCPMGDNQATSGGHVTDQQIAYFEARAQGGAALLLVGSVGITAPEGLSSPQQSAIGDSSFEAGWRRMADRVHAHGAKLALQLVHNGKNAVEDIIAARPLAVPSVPDKAATADPLMGMLTPSEAAEMGTPAQVKGARVIFQEMSHADIERMVEAYADAVVRARDAGVDGIELHAGHGYLIDNFLSPTTNHRSDEYGGSVENRARFLVEILHAIRQRVGPDFPVWCRINGEEYFIEGETLEDACRVAELAEAAGADALHVSAYADPARGIGYTEAHSTHTPGRFLDLAEAVKARIGIPVITVGRLSPDAAEDAIARGQADFVAMGRKLLADPDLPNKLAAGTPERVRPCLYHYRCISQIFVRAPIRCVANALTGYEAERRIEPARHVRRVLVVGGGPAGMEAARLGALRGHRVTLVEAESRLGGRFKMAAATTQPNAEFLRWLESEMECADIDVQLGTRLDAETIANAGYEEVVVATGGLWEPPELPGAEAMRVETVDSLLPWLEADPSASEQGQSFVILGGDRVGLSIAGCARARGADVEVLEESDVFAASNGLVGRWRYVHEAQEAGIALRPHARLTTIESRAVGWTDAEGHGHVAPADRIIVTSGARPDESLADTLRARGISVHSIGDCRAIEWVEGATRSAAELMLAMGA